MRLPVMFVVIGLLGCVTVARAQSAEESRALEVALSDETAQVRYIDPKPVGGRNDGEISYALFLSEERDVVGSAAALVKTRLRAGAFEIRIGPQAYAALLSEENNDVFALALGADARLNLSRNGALAVVGSAFWSPDVLTFGSADNLTDFMARAEMQLTDRLLGFAGYRWFELDLLERQERKLQNELFAGVRWQLR
jgi:hypothetical protein